MALELDLTFDITTKIPQDYINTASVVVDNAIVRLIVI
jgi:hypothetical protein